MNWHTAAVMCEELYGVHVDMKEGFFICPECSEPIYESDWEDYLEWDECPACGFLFEEG